VVVGGSVGVAIATDSGVDVLSLVEQADRDMYRAKRGQANRQRDGHGGGRPEAALPRAMTIGRNAPVWSVAMQGAATAPMAGWPGVRWSAFPSSGASWSAPTLVGPGGPG
jgi:hypothetical protein